MALRDLIFKIKVFADSKPMDDLGKKTTGLVGGFKKLGGALTSFKSAIAAAGVIALAREFDAVVDGLTKTSEDLVKLSQKLGIGTNDLQKLGFAAAQTDVNQEALQIGLRRLSVVVQGAAGGSEEMAQALHGVGVNGKLTGKTLADILPKIADKFAKMPDGIKKTATAVKLFGRSGSELIPLLNKGSAGIAELFDQAQRLGIVLSHDDLEAAQKYQQQLKVLQIEHDAFLEKAILPLLPNLIEMKTQFFELAKTVLKAINPLIQWLASADGMKETMKLLTSFAIGLGAALVLAFAEPLLTVVLFTALIRTALLVFEEWPAVMDAWSAALGAAFEFVMTPVNAFIDGLKEAYKFYQLITLAGENSGSGHRGLKPSARKLGPAPDLTSLGTATTRGLPQLQKQPAGNGKQTTNVKTGDMTVNINGPADEKTIKKSLQKYGTQQTQDLTAAALQLAQFGAVAE